jgi:hypothetical protein
MTGQDPTRFDPHKDELSERGRLLIAEAVAATRAPGSLRARVEAERERQAPVASRRRAWWLGGGLATAVATISVALVLGLVAGGGGGEGPTVFAVAALAARGPAEPPPTEDPGRPDMLRRGVEGVRFPYWGGRFRWEASGARSDRVGGRATTTVFYEGPSGARLGYSIVAGRRLASPSGARPVTVGGTQLWTLRRGDRTIVVWVRGGHTCVISAPAAVPVQRVQGLAAWHANV